LKTENRTAPQRPPRDRANVCAFQISIARTISHPGEFPAIRPWRTPLVPPAIFDRVGGFRSNVSEDVDWGHRATAAGYHWSFRSDVHVTRPARRDWGELITKWRRLPREAYAGAGENRYGRTKFVMFCVLILCSTFVHWMAVAKSPRRNTVGQRLGAIGVLFAIRFWRFLECNRLLIAGLRGDGSSAKSTPARKD
jgi:hypothetical protein